MPPLSLTYYLNSPLLEGPMLIILAWSIIADFCYISALACLSSEAPSPSYLKVDRVHIETFAVG